METTTQNSRLDTRLDRILIAVPCLNESKTIAQVIANAKSVQVQGKQIDVLVVDDGSKDDTSAVAKQAGAHVIRHGKNRGLAGALNTAVEYAIRQQYAMMVTIDGDGQFDVKDVPSLIAPIIQSGADLVTGSRFMPECKLPDGITPAKVWGNIQMSRLISSLVGQKFYDVSCGFRAYSRAALLNLNLHGKFTYTHETFLDLAFKGFHIVETPVTVKYFADRKSRMASSLFRYGFQASKIIARSFRDHKPLKLFWVLALMALLPGVGLAIHFFSHFFETGEFRGHLWAGFLGGSFLAVSLTFFIVGIFADMLRRVHQNQEKTLYILKTQWK